MKSWLKFACVMFVSQDDSLRDQFDKQDQVKKGDQYVTDETTMVNSNLRLRLKSFLVSTLKTTIPSVALDLSNLPNRGHL